MFRVGEIKNRNRRGASAKKHRDIPLEELQNRRPEERTVPYFSIVPEQVYKDSRFKALSPEEQGLFLLWCTNAWRRGGMVDNFPAGNADTLGISVEELNRIQSHLVDSGLLVVSNDGLRLFQPELREQYLQFIERESSTLKD